MKQAQIKSVRDLYQRMLDGEVFYSTKGHKVYFDDSKHMPFRYGNGSLDKFHVANFQSLLVK